MLRYFLYVICALIFGGLQFATAGVMQEPIPLEGGGGTEVLTLIIDPGHGGRDNGCSGAHSKEKHIALGIALSFGDYIKINMPEVKVLYTRDKDVFVPLHERAEFANKNKGDLFISIHCNAYPKNKNIAGAETYVMGLHTAEENLEIAKENLSVATRENESILLEDNYEAHYDGYDPNSAEGHIILSMFQNANLMQSILLATKLQSEFKNRAQRKTRGVRQAGFVVLRKTAMPSVLIETGYLTNAGEENYLVTKAGQQTMAEAMFFAFKAYRDEIDLLNASEGGPQMVSSEQTPAPEKAIIADQPKTIKQTDDEFVVFKVQLASSKTPIDLNSAKWKPIKDKLEQDYVGGIYKYLVGGSKSYEKGIMAQNEWRTNGFQSAFIVAYQGGKRINLQKAKELAAAK